jgi:hypothetical protein
VGSLSPASVSVEGRGKSEGYGEGVKDAVERRERYFSPNWFITGSGFKITTSEQGLIAQHLFKMRNVPLRVDAITGKSPLDVIVETAKGHGSKNAVGGLALVAIEQCSNVARTRETWCSVATVVVGLLSEVVRQRQANLVYGQSGVAGGEVIDEGYLLAKRALELLGLFFDVIASLTPRRRNHPEKSSKADLTTTINGWVVGAGSEGSCGGREKDRHRPTTVPTHQLRGGHVHLVDVGTFLTVDLDSHEIISE